MHRALGIMSGEELWLFDLANAGAVVPLTPLLGVPLTRQWFAGVANVRGALYSVVDFADFCGNGPTRRDSNARLLLIGAAQGSALLVGRTLGLRNLEAMTEQASGHRSRLVWMGPDYRDEQGQIWHSVQTEALLTCPEFLSIGSQHEGGSAFTKG